MGAARMRNRVLASVVWGRQETQSLLGLENTLGPVAVSCSGASNAGAVVESRPDAQETWPPNP